MQPIDRVVRNAGAANDIGGTREGVRPTHESKPTGRRRDTQKVGGDGLGLSADPDNPAPAGGDDGFVNAGGETI